MNNRRVLRPDRATVIRIAKEVAKRAGLPWEDLFNSDHRAAYVCARAEAMCLIREETGCSYRGLADVWGADYAGVRRLIEKHKARLTVSPTTPAYYLSQYMATLRFLYPDRAEKIISGKDPKSNADRAAWLNLGARRAA